LPTLINHTGDKGSTDLVQQETTDCRFPKSVRLCSAAEFKNVFEKPRKINSAGFSLYVRTNQLQYSRLGLAIPKKAVKLASSRNRLKRLVRESFRHHRDLGSVDIVFLAYKGVDERTNQDIMCALEQAWRRVKQHA